MAVIYNVICLQLSACSDLFGMNFLVLRKLFQIDFGVVNEIDILTYYKREVDC